MRTSFQLVAVIRNIAVLANVASLVTRRFAASFNPEMYRLCYVHRETVDRGRTVGPMPGSWRSDRHLHMFGIAHNPVMRPTDLKRPQGNFRTITHPWCEEQSSQRTLG
jgi:hypothetical protein